MKSLAKIAPWNILADEEIIEMKPSKDTIIISS
jgi:hypothetical protein